ncbi:MAG TPA: ATP-binding cassette domain-containing protein, partial [Chitinophagales bacterium]|nr:ATP-binding cassette domain-containing protein [Chitinophagales bacterium]
MIKSTANIDPNQTVISIKGLYKAFGEREILRGVDLHLLKGENLVVLGRSGTGKSVLIKIIVGLLKQDAGSLVVLGQEVEKLDEYALRDLRLKIGFS